MGDAAWEQVSDEGEVATTRMRVAGGWLYRVTIAGPAGIALAFVPAGASAGGVAASDTGEDTEDAPRSDD